MTIRFYTPTDLEPLFALIRAAFKEHEGVVDPPPSAASKTLELLQEELNEFEAFVVKKGRLIGCVLYKSQADSLYLGRLSVLPKLRGRGVASLLLKQLEQEAQRRGFSALTLNVRVNLTRQQSIYRHWGFEVSGYGAHEGYSKPTFLRMRKALEQDQDSH